jgi:hypothetical protein
MMDRGIDGLAPAQGVARMPLLSARLLAGLFPQTADPDRLFFNPSLEGGLPLLLLFKPNRRSRSAIRA